MKYQETVDGIVAGQLAGGFFEGWPNPPRSEAHLRILQGSSHLVLAISDSGDVVGFITAISDGVSSAYIPHLEVLPQYRGQGIGKDLVLRMLAQLSSLYMIDLCCDKNVVEFYDKLGFRQSSGMAIRNYAYQACDTVLDTSNSLHP